RQVVEHDDALTTREQRVGEMRADEPRPTGDQVHARTHRRPPTSRRPALCRRSALTDGRHPTGGASRRARGKIINSIAGHRSRELRTNARDVATALPALRRYNATSRIPSCLLSGPGKRPEARTVAPPSRSV